MLALANGFNCEWNSVAGHTTQRGKLTTRVLWWERQNQHVGLGADDPGIEP